MGTYAIYFFIIAMIIVAVAYVVWTVKTRRGNKVVSVNSASLDGLNINALVQRKTMFLFTQLPQDTIDRLFNGWDTFSGKPIILCQQEAIGADVEAWMPTSYPLSKDLPSETPEQLGKITGWKQVIRLFARKRGTLEMINQMLMICVLVGLLLVGYLYFTSSTGV